MLGVAIVFVVTASATVFAYRRDPPDTAATAFCAVLTLGCSIWASFVAGRRTALDAAQDILRPTARNAFRHVVSMFYAFQQIGENANAGIETLNERADAQGRVKLDLAAARLELVRELSIQQIHTADHAMDAWRDILPDEVAGLVAMAGEESDGPN